MTHQYLHFLRNPDAGPGHPEIIVDCDSDGRPLTNDSGEVQCYTLDRTPFCIPVRRFHANYRIKP